MKALKWLMTWIALAFAAQANAMYYDAETGLNDNLNRSYQPSTGRYTQPDPIGLLGGWNRNGYAYQNPLGYTDSDGLNPVAGALNGGRLGAAAGSPLGPPGVVVGGLLGAGAGATLGWWLTGPMLSESEKQYPDNPDVAPENFRPIKGSGGKQCDDGSV